MSGFCVAASGPGSTRACEIPENVTTCHGKDQSVFFPCSQEDSCDIEFAVFVVAVEGTKPSVPE
jgi:hypothetical protein